MEVIDVLRREVSMTPAFDKRSADPSKNYGVHGVDLRMYVIGARGAVQFVLYTNWMLPNVDATPRARWLDKPMPADLGYHSPIPTYEGQEDWGRDDCHLLGCRCYYDGSGLNAERIYDVLLREGSDGVWRELESFYDEVLPSMERIAAEGARA
jgi:hypothetical protein